MNKVNKKDNLIYGSLVRKIIRKSKTAVLSSYLNGSEWPYGSLVLSCCEHDGSPYVFISELAEHTKAIRMNNKVSIFYENCSFLDDPLTGTRFSMLCKAFDVRKKGERKLLLNRFVLRHPESKIYSKFNDFNIFKFSVEKIHVISGFGKIRWQRLLLAGEERIITLALVLHAFQVGRQSFPAKSVSFFQRFKKECFRHAQMAWA